MNQQQSKHHNLDSSITDDEIDLIELFKTLWSQKKLIITITSVCILITGIYSIVAPKEYKAQTSFFMTSSNNNASRSLMGYASILGINTPSNIESLIKNILKSNSIKTTVAHAFRTHYDQKIQTAIQNNKLPNKKRYINNYILGHLKLHKQFNFSVNKTHLFELTYYATDPQLTKKVLDTYLDQIIQYNYNLELSAEKNIITIVDPPQVPLGPFKPKLKLNILLASILGLFSSSIFIIVRHAIKHTK
jgi:uncharacterized protein involved in exopolysaccharide biosynthesis